MFILFGTVYVYDRMIERNAAIFVNVRIVFIHNDVINNFNILSNVQDKHNILDDVLVNKSKFI